MLLGTFLPVRLWLISMQYNEILILDVNHNYNIEV